MNLAVDLRFSKAEFLRWVQRQEGRYELQNGRVVMMTGGTINHSRIYTSLASALLTRLPHVDWSVTIADVAVEIADDIRYPDIMVSPTAGIDGTALLAPSPAFIAEVLSPSSLHLDFGVKAQEYMSLPSLQTYAVAAQDAPRLWLWERGETGAFPKEPVIIEGAEATVELKHFGIAIPLAEIFRAILPS